ncbi:MAG: hypothetical protein QME59_07030 [Candidatus Hydrothermarchaeota archaeon]|nr:hypothetical protein [Candidatus Hydrothermarchaeota archaeon]
MQDRLHQGENRVRKAQFTLTAPESKRLIGRAVKEHEWVKKALKNGIVAIALGSTNAFVAEEILGRKIKKEKYIAGFVDEHGTCVIPAPERLKSVVLEKGRIIKENIEEVVKRMKNNDVFIKGANALDFEGTAGVMMASLVGGTIANVLGVIKARGIKLIIPVGLEKLIPHSVDEISKAAGIYEVSYSTGIPVGIMPVSGEIITEIEAFEILAGVSAVSIGSGSIGSSSCRTFLVDGEEKKVRKAIEIVESIKGEKEIKALRGDCTTCVYTYCPLNKKDI